MRPTFRREIEEAIAGAIPVMPDVPLVITEGNYLLLQQGHWTAVRPLLDEAWYVDVDPELRLQRLIARHVKFGRDEDAAREWVQRTDEVNAALVDTTRGGADLVSNSSTCGPIFHSAWPETERGNRVTPT
jgi:pantothenate kinase